MAQKVHFTNNTNQWLLLDSTNACCIPYPQHVHNTHFDGRTQYNGHTYQSLIYALGSCLVREDAGKVYVVGTTDSTERLLYDFNLGLNDTIRTMYPQDTYTAWVTQLDSTQISGTWYKVWHFEGSDNNGDSLRAFRYNVIEGIGCTNGPYYPVAPYDLVTFSDQLLCFKNDMGLSTGFSAPVLSFGYDYFMSFDNSTSCSKVPVVPVVPVDSSLLLTRQLTQKNGIAMVVPNPATENSRIILPFNISAGTLTIINNLGQVVSSSSFTDKNELPLAPVNIPGIYCFRITDDVTGEVLTGRFVY